MTGKLKIRQIAELTGLSPSTVSRVLAGKANVSPQAKEKVFTHARNMGILRDIPASRLLMNTLLICAPPAAFSPHEDLYYYEA
ncbi:LacI family DNA-binding transcriptional regulator, partial [Salmonella enterica subsp. enterica]